MYNLAENKYNFSLMAFPAASICNLNCEYCYYLDKRNLYPAENKFKMSEKILEKYIKQYLDAVRGPIVQFGWQGGEPTLRGIDFFKKVIELQQKYLPAGWHVENSLQTNGTLLNDQWAQFLKENKFLVGISIDGPAALHNKYRKDKLGQGSFSKVLAGLEKLENYQVDYNVLTVVNDSNSQQPNEVYGFLKDLKVNFMQFIPIVELDQEGDLTSRSVKPIEYAKFLIKIFNQWITDIGEVYVQIFEEVLGVYLGRQANLCIFNSECGKGPVMEYNGDLYSCDHFVDPEYRLGNINDKSILEMMNSKKQYEFGRAKRENLNQKCLICDYLFICNGGCPKNRIIDTGDKCKLNYLCDGYKLFFAYIDVYMKKLALLVKQQKSPAIMRQEMQKIYKEKWDVGRNDSCPCGSGKKYKKCCL